MRRRALAVLAAGAAAAAVGAAAWATIPGPDGVISGCYDRQSGQLRVTDADGSTPKTCTAREEPLSWSQRGPRGVVGPRGPRGPQGPAGTFSGTLRSPDGRFSLSVTNAGIELDGPSGSVRVDNAGVTVSATAIVRVEGKVVRLNGCKTSLARSGDPIEGTLSGQVVRGTITGGLASVCTG